LTPSKILASVSAFSSYVLITEWQGNKMRRTSVSKATRHQCCSSKNEKQQMHPVQCSYKCAKTSNLKMHIMNVHFKNRDFQCEQCDKLFGWKSSLKKHINSTHKKIKRFWCDLCDYSSNTRGNLEIHSNTALSIWRRNV
jgi:uncharacterized C2H2 Zn-finger protein